ncbi:TonB-dependent receptor [Hymenobacter sp. NBH84]|nr:TonB-dependent receptor [Hymenobacter sp. NBH84]
MTSSLPPSRLTTHVALFLFFLLLGHLAQAQTLLTGRVTNAAGAPLSGASVGVQGTNVGTDTDSNGDYTLTLSQGGTYVVGVRLLGYLNQEHRVTVKAGEKQTRNFILVPGDRQLEEVTVQGDRTNKFSRKSSEYVGKMPLSNLENPQVYATVGKELLTEQLVFSVDDATRNAPGLQKMWEPTGRSGDGGSFYASRGFVVSSQLRNGVAGGVTSTIDAANLEKLEVIKGPSATLYGSALTSYGGLLNRVTKKPYETFGGEVALSAGSYGFHRASVDVNTPLNSTKTLAFRLNGAYTYEDSWQNRGYAGFAKDIAIAPSLQFQPTDRLTINLDAEVYRSTNVGKQLIYIPFDDKVENFGFSRADQAPLDYRQSYQGPGLTQDSRSTNLFAQVRYRISPSFTSTTYLSSSRSYSQGRGPYFYMISDITLAARDSITLTTPGVSTLLRNDQSTRDSRRQTYQVQQLFNGDFQLAGLRNRVVLGLDFLRLDSNIEFFGGQIDAVPINALDYDYRTFNKSAVDAAYAANTPPSYPVTTKINTYSAFASDVLNVTNKLSVLAAIRVDRYDNEGGLLYFPVNSYKQTAVSPKFGVVYQPVKDRVALFANYQNSFNNQNSSFLDAQGQLSVTKPERANQAEAGVKLDAAGGLISATVSYYDIRVQNVLRIVGMNEAGLAISAQDGTQWSRGAELNLTANPVQGLNIVGGFAYNYSKAVDTDPNFNGRRPETASSPYLANGWVSYRQPTGALRGLGLGFGGNYASDNKIINKASQGVFTLPSYTVLNASAFYDLPHYRFAVKMDNLTNEHYWIGYTTINAQKLRSIIGSIAYKF